MGKALWFCIPTFQCFQEPKERSCSLCSACWTQLPARPPPWGQDSPAPSQHWQMPAELEKPFSLIVKWFPSLSALLCLDMAPASCRATSSPRSHWWSLQTGLCWHIPKGLTQIIAFSTLRRLLCGLTSQILYNAQNVQSALSVQGIG